MENHNLVKRFKKKVKSKKLKSVAKSLLPLALMLGFRVAFADSVKDFNLDSLNSSISDHLSGDVGKLMGLGSIIWLIVGSIAGFNARLVISVFAVLLMITFGPTIVSALFG